MKPSTLCKMGTIAPKGRSPYSVLQAHTSPNDYFAGRGPSQFHETEIWARNAQEAQALAGAMDTMDGTAVGWETISVVPC